MPNEQWLELRKKGIGGSDASVVCGVNKYKSPVELFMEKTGQIPPAEAGEPAYWGKQLESLVRLEFTKRTGIDVVPVNKLIRSKEYPFMLANLDGVCKHPDYGPCIFEAKTASAFKSDEWNNAVPIEYILQVQHYLAVTGYIGVYVAVLIGGNTFKWEFLKIDEELISMIIKQESDFWEHVQLDIPPSLDGSEATALFLKKQFPTANKSKVTLPDEALALINQFETAKAKVDQYTKEKQKAENLLKQMLGNNHTGTVGDRTITWINVHQEQFDNETWKSDHPELCQKYVSQTSYRRFTVKKAS
jgi:putative phage-type endonuclease